MMPKLLDSKVMFLSKDLQLAQARQFDRGRLHKNYVVILLIAIFWKFGKGAENLRFAIGKGFQELQSLNNIQTYLCPLNKY